MRLFLHERAEFAHLFHRHLARLEPVQTGHIHTGQRGHRAIGIDHLDQRQLVALADFKVRLVMRGRHLQHAGAEFKIHVLVRDDGNELLLARHFRRQRADHVLADEMRVARVLGIHRHGGVRRDGFRPGGGNRQPRVRFLRDLHLEIIHEAFLRLHFHFLIREGGLRHRAPVHHALSAINQTLLVQFHEHLLDAAGIFRVHGEPFARPVARATKLLELVDDDVAVLFLPHPHALEEFLAPEVVARLLLLLLKLLFHHHLGGDARVVGAG